MNERSVQSNRRCIKIAIVAALGGLASCFLAACGRDSAKANAAPENRLVLYVSADDALFRPIVRLFEEQTGARILIVGDTEATKTFGLVRRLMDEKESPKADVFWASEPIGVIRLGQSGVLRPIPASIDPSQPLWLPLAYRARVIAYHTGRFENETPPRRLGDLLKPEFMGKIGLARPQFGTTRTHMAALLTQFGETEYEAFVRALKANGARLYDGNSMVVQAIAQGEISAGLTDSDDVAAGKAEKWPVDFRGGTAELDASAPSQGEGAILMMPQVAALVAHPSKDSDASREALAQDFVRFLLADPVQRLFVSSGAALKGGWPAPSELQTAGHESLPDFAKVAASETRAVEIFERVWAEP
ncbi:MAG: extracellular solute-binding protein [Phycisphaeraceae bacterium]|nr:extracellular solute-binding protein [Phycisphaeraceae bacterium]